MVSHVGNRQVNLWLLTEYERDPDVPFWLMTPSYGVHQPRALLDWCDEVPATLEKRGKLRNKRKRG
jgi:hypothetical protein